jgi:ParB-like chromosome segregation protein Spo0J
MKTTVPFFQLVQDTTIYPRRLVDESHVRNLARAIRAGAVLPPVIVERRTNRIVDGIHRTRAFRAVYGDRADVPVEYRTYRDDAALLQDAVALNSSHGRPLGSADQTRAAHLLLAAGVAEERIAVTMGTTVDHVQRLLLRVVIVDDEPRPAKPSLWPPKGEAPRHITPQQEQVHRSANGWRHAQTIQSLIRELDAGLVDVDRHAELLGRLRDAIDVALGAVATQAAR